MVPQTNMNRCDAYRFTFQVIIGGFMGIFGIVSNCLTVYTLWGQRNTVAINFLILMLAIFDSLYLGVVFTLSTTTTYCSVFSQCNYFIGVVYPNLVAYWMAPLGAIIHTAGTWIVVTIAVHRYIAVCRPHDAKKWSSMRITRFQVGLSHASRGLNR